MIEARIAQLVDRAFDYRGYVTLRRSDGSEVVGFVYDRGASHLELLDQSATRRMRVPLAEIADIAFTGEDAARIIAVFGRPERVDMVAMVIIALHEQRDPAGIRWSCNRRCLGNQRRFDKRRLIDTGLPSAGVEL